MPVFTEKRRYRPVGGEAHHLGYKQGIQLETLSSPGEEIGQAVLFRYPASLLQTFRACRALPVPRCRSGQKLRHPPKPYTPDMAFLIDLSHLSFRCHYDLVVFPHYRTHTGIAGYRGGQQHPVKVQKVAQSVGFLLPFELAVQGWSMGLFPFVNPFRMVYLRSQWSGKEYFMDHLRQSLLAAVRSPALVIPGCHGGQ